MPVKRQIKYLYGFLLCVAAFALYEISSSTPINIFQNEKTQVSVQELPEAGFFDESGTKRTLNDFKGSYVLVNLWATWCPPCVVELPALDSLQAKLKNDNFQVVAISMDRSDITTVMSFFEKRHIEHLQAYWDKERQISLTWKYDGLPMSFLLDKEGHIIEEFKGSFAWDQPPVFDKIKSLLK